MGTLRKITPQILAEKKARGEKITMITAYDYPSAKLADAAGVDIILVGDSLSMVVLGLESTVPVDLETMLHHCRAVKRGAGTSMLIGDMPFLSYGVTREESIRNAGRFLKEGGMEIVKIEGGVRSAETIKALVDAQIPVMGHIGLTPQSIHAFGGYRIQGKTSEIAEALVRDAQAVEQAGATSLVIEGVPSVVGEIITENVNIPTIGIGAGAGCDGQVLVFHDLLGLNTGHVPKFVKQYLQGFQFMKEAIEQYGSEVRAGTFPGPEHGYEMNPEEETKLRKRFKGWKSLAV